MKSLRTFQFSGTTDAGLVRLSTSPIGIAARFFAKRARRRPVIVDWSTIVSVVAFTSPFEASPTEVN